MALLSEVGTFTSTAGPQDVTLSTFAGTTPKAVLIWHSGSTADGVAAGAKIGFGIGVSASSRAAVTVSSEDAQTTSDADRRHTNASVLTLMDYAQAVIEAGNIAMAADKFTITYSTSLTGVLYNYMVLGGDDLTDVYLDTIEPTATGSLARTGIGFQPTSLIGVGAAVLTVPGTTASVYMTLGVSDGTTDRCVDIYGQNAAGTSNTKRAATDKFLRLDDGLGGNFEAATVTSLDADGYTVNFSAASAGTYDYTVLCLKGPQVKVLTGDQPATDTTATRTIGFAPKAALVTTAMGVSSASAADDARIGIGGWDASNNMAFAGAVDEDNQTTTDADRIQDSNEAIKHIDHTQTVVGSASFAASGTDLIETWTNTDGTQREHALLVFGDAAVSGSNCTHPLTQSLVYPLVESLAKPLTT